MLIDKKGNLWIGCEETPLIMIAKTGEITKKIIGSNNCCYAIAEDKESSVWAASLNSGIFRFKNGVWKQYTVYDGLPDNRIFNIAISPTGIPFIATPKGPAAFSKNSWKLLKINGMTDPELSSIMFDGEGRLWAGSWNSGIYLSKNGRWKQFTEKDGLAGNRVKDMISLDNNRIAIACYPGLSILNTDKMTFWNPPLPESARKKLQPAFFVCLWYDSIKQRLWAGTRKEGLMYINLSDPETKRRWKIIRDRKEFRTTYPTVIVPDTDNQHLLIGTHGEKIIKVKR